MGAGVSAGESVNEPKAGGIRSCLNGPIMDAARLLCKRPPPKVFNPVRSMARPAAPIPVDKLDFQRSMSVRSYRQASPSAARHSVCAPDRVAVVILPSRPPPLREFSLMRRSAYVSLERAWYDVPSEAAHPAISASAPSQVWAPATGA